jgi:hypothetical protein
MGNSPLTATVLLPSPRGDKKSPFPGLPFREGAVIALRILEGLFRRLLDLTRKVIVTNLRTLVKHFRRRSWGFFGCVKNNLMIRGGFLLEAGAERPTFG